MKEVTQNSWANKEAYAVHCSHAKAQIIKPSVTNTDNK